MFVAGAFVRLFLAWLCLFSTTRAFPNRKFQQWYGYYGLHFNSSSTITCNQTLAVYLEEYSLDNLAIAHHADCILANTTETIKANMGSASVILGLTPSLLSYLGPTVSELSILALERPFLSALLALGGPAIWPTRGFEEYSSLEATRTIPNVLAFILSVWWMQYAVSAFEYCVAIALATNVIILCVELGWKTVVTWKKRNSYLPLTWVVLTLLVQFCAAIRLYFARKGLQNDAGETCPRVTKKTPWSFLGHLFVAEMRLCCLRPRQDSAWHREDRETLFWYNFGIALSAICVTHQVLGVVIFSSLLFIGVNDIITVIIRLGISALIAQYIRIFEITGLLAGPRQSYQGHTTYLDPYSVSLEERNDPDEECPMESSQTKNDEQANESSSASTREGCIRRLSDGIGEASRISTVTTEPKEVMSPKAPDAK